MEDSGMRFYAASSAFNLMELLACGAPIIAFIAAAFHATILEPGIIWSSTATRHACRIGALHHVGHKDDEVMQEAADYHCERAVEGPAMKSAHGPS